MAHARAVCLWADRCVPPRQAKADNGLSKPATPRLAIRHNPSAAVAGKNDVWFQYFYTKHHARLARASARTQTANRQHGNYHAHLLTPRRMRSESRAVATRRQVDANKYWADEPPRLVTKGDMISVAMTRSPLYEIPRSHRWGIALDAVAAVLPKDEHGRPPAVVDACLDFPRLSNIRATAKEGLQCPNVMYRRNGTHWRFEESRELPFKGRPL